MKIKLPDTDDFDKLKQTISDYAFKETKRRYPPIIISAINIDSSAIFKEELEKFEKKYNVTLDHIADFESKYYFGAIYERPEPDPGAVYGKDLLIFVKKTFFDIE